jgi:hypothetical protein
VRDFHEGRLSQAEGFRPARDTPGRRKKGAGRAGGNGRPLLPSRYEQVGDQTGGRVFLFLHTDDFRRDYERMLSRGVRFIEEPRHEAYGTVAVFLDLYGNKWDLVQPRAAS